MAAVTRIVPDANRTLHKYTIRRMKSPRRSSVPCFRSPVRASSVERRLEFRHRTSLISLAFPVDTCLPAVARVLATSAMARVGVRIDADVFARFLRSVAFAIAVLARLTLVTSSRALTTMIVARRHVDTGAITKFCGRLTIPLAVTVEARIVMLT